MATPQQIELLARLRMKMENLTGSGWDSLNSHIRGTQKNIHALGSDIKGNLLGMLGAQAFQDALSGITHIGYEFISLNAQMEQVHQTFASLLTQGNTGADAALNYLTQFALQAPFTQQSVFEAGKQIASIGLNVQQAMPYLGDLAAVMGQTLPTAAQALTDAYEGRFYMMQRDLHITKNELVDYGLQVDNTGHIIQSSLLPALIKLENAQGWHAANGDKTGGMARQMSTFSGFLTNLTDTYQIFARSMGKPVFDALKGDTKQLIDYLTNAQNKMELILAGQDVGQVLGQGVRIILSLVKDLMGALPDAMDRIDSIFVRVKPMIQDVADAMTGTGGAIKSTVDQITSSLQKALGPMALGGVVFLLKDVLLGALRTVVEYVARYVVIFGGIGLVIEKVSPYVQTLADQLLPHLRDLFAAIVQNAQSLWPQIQHLGDTLRDNFYRAVTTLKGPLGDLATAVGKTLKDVFGSAKDLLKQLNDALTTALPAAIAVAKGAIQGLTGVLQVCHDHFKAVQLLVEGAFATALGVKLAGIIATAIGNIAKLIQVLAAIATTIWSTVIPALVAFGKQVWLQARQTLAGLVLYIYTVVIPALVAQRTAMLLAMGGIGIVIAAAIIAYSLWGDKIRAVANIVKTDLLHAFQTIKNYVQGFFQDIPLGVVTMIRDIATLLTRYIVLAYTPMAVLIMEIKNLFIGLGNFLLIVFSDIFNGLIGLVNDAIFQIDSMINSSLSLPVLGGALQKMGVRGNIDQVRGHDVSWSLPDSVTKNMTINPLELAKQFNGTFQGLLLNNPLFKKLNDSIDAQVRQDAGNRRAQALSAAEARREDAALHQDTIKHLDQLKASHPAASGGMPAWYIKATGGLHNDDLANRAMIKMMQNVAKMNETSTDPRNKAAADWKAMLADLKGRVTLAKSTVYEDLASNADVGKTLGDLNGLMGKINNQMAFINRYATPEQRAQAAGFVNKTMLPVEKRVYDQYLKNMRNDVRTGAGSDQLGSDIYAIKAIAGFAGFDATRDIKVILQNYFLRQTASAKAQFSQDLQNGADQKTLWKDIRGVLQDMANAGKSQHQVERAAQQLAMQFYKKQLTNDKAAFYDATKGGGGDPVAIAAAMKTVLNDEKQLGYGPARLRQEQIQMYQSLRSAQKANMVQLDFGPQLTNSAYLKEAGFGNTQVDFGLQQNSSQSQIIARLEQALNESRMQNAHLQAIIGQLTAANSALNAVSQNTTAQVQDMTISELCANITDGDNAIIGALKGHSSTPGAPTKHVDKVNVHGKVVSLTNVGGHRVVIP